MDATTANLMRRNLNFVDRMTLKIPLSQFEQHLDQYETVMSLAHGWLHSADFLTAKTNPPSRWHRAKGSALLVITDRQIGIYFGKSKEWRLGPIDQVERIYDAEAYWCRQYGHDTLPSRRTVAIEFKDDDQTIGLGSIPQHVAEHMIDNIAEAASNQGVNVRRY